MRSRSEIDELVASAQTTAQLGELVVAAFEGAADHSSDPREAARLASVVVIHMLRHARRSFVPRMGRRAPLGQPPV